MPLKALFLGSIGVICETSAMQRHAFNTAFQEAGLDWRWDEPDYSRRLVRPGGARRIADFAAERDETVDAAALHARKTEIFQEMLRHAPLPLRPGVADTVIAARVTGLTLGFVTTTQVGTIEAMLDAAEPRIMLAEFGFIGHRDMVARPKPAPDIYLHALDHLDLASHEALTIEDSPESAASAVAAGIPTVAFPGAAHSGREFPGVVLRLDRLSPRALGLESRLYGGGSVTAA